MEKGYQLGGNTLEIVGTSDKEEPTGASTESLYKQPLK
jgi:hypothetical protein